MIIKDAPSTCLIVATFVMVFGAVAMNAPLVMVGFFAFAGTSSWIAVD